MLTIVGNVQKYFNILDNHWIEVGNTPIKYAKQISLCYGQLEAILGISIFILLAI